MITSLRDYKSTPYAFNPQFFEDYKKHNRIHQTDLLAAAATSPLGQLLSPCGTGKTRVQICLHAGGMIHRTQAQQDGVSVIASHRLSLNRQLMDELVEVVVHCGIPFDILCIGSDREDTKRYYAQYASLGYSPSVSRHLTSLTSREIENFIAQARTDNRQALVVSTYNSIDRLKNVDVINLITYDEAQNIVRDDFTSNILQIRQNVLRQYYFTATRKVKADNGGMANEEFFGKVLEDIKPQLMLERGEIAEPRIHEIRGVNYETTNTDNTPMLTKNATEAFLKHKERIKLDSISPDDVGAKIIMGCNGIQEMEEVYNFAPFRDFVGTHNIPFFAISSDGAYVNGLKVNNEEFFQRLHSLNDSEDAIILNVDMLTEGIDLPSITGVMPLRNLGVIKLIQLIGRALRLHKKDRARLYTENLVPGDHINYIKPYGHLILPEHLNSLHEYEQMKKTIKDVYAEYKTPEEVMVIQDKFIDTTPEDLPSMLDDDQRDGKQYGLQHDIMSPVAAVLLDRLKDRTVNMNPFSKVNYILSLTENKP